MSKHHGSLPQLCGGLLLTGGGIETTLIFHDRIELPHFAAFHLLPERKGREALDGPAYYMINCAYPTHFEHALLEQEEWTKRIRGIRANASRRSHQELNDALDLDAGDPIELGGLYRELLRHHPQINVLGGCCGTDHRHVGCIGIACRLKRSTSSLETGSGEVGVFVVENGGPAAFDSLAKALAAPGRTVHRSGVVQTSRSG